MINIILPNFFYFNKINESLFLLKREHPEYFINKNINFIAQEGNFPFCYWAGRNTVNYKTALQNTMFDFFKTTRLPIILDCANPLLKEIDYNNIANNTALQLGQNGSNQVLVSSIDLLNYIKQKYPFYQFIASEYYITSDVKLESINLLTRIKVPLTLLNNYNNIPKNKIEIVLNDPCENCIQKSECLIKEWSNIYNFKEKSQFLICPINKKRIDISWQDIMTLYDQGYEYFCFDTKTINLNNIDYMKNLYIELFIKNEYKNQVNLFFNNSGD